MQDVLARFPIDGVTTTSTYIRVGGSSKQAGPAASAPGVPVTAPPWAPGTAYAVGANVANGANLYRAAAPGTSASSGGPTGTTSPIADGSAIWSFVSAYVAGAVQPLYGPPGPGSFYANPQANSVDNAITPVPWTRNTPYSNSPYPNVYVTNAGNLYKINTPGTSAASGGPTGTGGGFPIPDGGSGLSWFYISPAIPGLAWNSPSPGGQGIRVSGNTLLRTLPSVTAYVQWGYGSGIEVGTTGYFTGGISESVFTGAVGIHMVGAMTGAIVSDNIIQVGGTSGIDFDPNAVSGDYDGLDIHGNLIRDFSDCGIRWPNPVATNQNIRIYDNRFDGDPLFRLSGRNANGTWTGSGTVNYGLYLAYANGIDIERNHFRNVTYAVSGMGTGAFWNLRDNVLHANPAAVGSSPSNGGIYSLPLDGAEWGYAIEGTDPTLPSYGQRLSQTLLTATAQPTSGTYVQGHFIRNATMSAGPNALTGWQRLTTGSSNTAGTDWLPLYASTSAVISSRTGDAYTAPGATLLSSGGTVTPLPSNYTYVLVSGGSIASATIVLPAVAGLADGQVVRMLFNGAIASPTFTSADSKTIAGAPASIVANSQLAFVWAAAFNEWVHWQ